jgi:hypothetical protein
MFQLYERQNQMKLIFTITTERTINLENYTWIPDIKVPTTAAEAAAIEQEWLEAGATGLYDLIEETCVVTVTGVEE